MGKRLIQQRRGTGSPVYRAPGHKFKGRAAHPPADGQGKIVEFISCPAHSAPLAVINYEEGNSELVIAAEGMKIGNKFETGKESGVIPGNSIPLSEIPEGTAIYNIEGIPGDGGKFVRSSGTAAKVVSKARNQVTVLLPSKKRKVFNMNCKANIGIVAGGGRKEKPFLKAGTVYHKMRSKNKLYPSVSGTSMNAVDHPLGGTTSSNKGRPTIAPKNAPAGRKVGMVRPSRSGRKKR